MRVILMFHNCEGQRKQCPQTTAFEEKGEPKRISNRGPSAYQPNARPQGQTGSLKLEYRLPRYTGHLSLKKKKKKKKKSCYRNSISPEVTPCG